jgi:hypothetical protein
MEVLLPDLAKVNTSSTVSSVLQKCGLRIIFRSQLNHVEISARTMIFAPHTTVPYLRGLRILKNNFGSIMNQLKLY